MVNEPISDAAPQAPQRISLWGGYALALFPAALFAFFLSQVGSTDSGTVVEAPFPLAPSLGIAITFYLDGLSLLMALLITGIGALVIIYTQVYLPGHRYLNRLNALLLLFMAAMLGLVTAGNVIVLFIFWELTSVSSYLLIGFNHEQPAARKAALQALLLTGLGGLALFAGLLLMGQIAGSYDLASLLNSGPLLRDHAWYPIIVVLVLLGAFTKSAQFPFHFWLPNAMAAPTPVSAYLHSATMVKAGVFLLARFTPILGDTSLWFTLLTGFGAVTLLGTGYLALVQTDLKRILAYSTVSVLGMLTFLIGLGTAKALMAAMVFLLGHALYKAALFLTVGIVDHKTGTREIGKLSGLAWIMPLTAGVAGLAALSQAGLPPLFGFIGKELVYKTTLALTGFGPLLVLIALVGNMLLTAIAIQSGLLPYFGRRPEGTSSPQIFWLFNTAPLVLAGLGLILGLVPQALTGDLLAAAAGAAQGSPYTYPLALWHGVNLPLVLSMMTLVGGIILISQRGYFRRLAGHWGCKITAWGPNRAYDRIFAGFLQFSQWQTRLVQSGYLRNYLLFLILGVLAVTGYSLWHAQEIVWPQAVQPLLVHEVVLAIIMLASGLTAALTAGRLSSIAALSVVGFGVALIYVFYGAPDLAITQILVETLTVILLVIVAYRLPEFKSFTSRWKRIRDIAVSVTFGGLMALLVLQTVAQQSEAKISSYFVENSLPLAHGRNIVNVILVDFRALDTLGEILVLATAALGVYALMRLVIKAPAKHQIPTEEE